MKITIEQLNELNACKDGTDWFQAQKETEHETVILKLLDEDKFNWANWLIVRFLGRKERIKYAVYAAKLALPIWENYAPNDASVAAAIKAAETCIKNNTKENRTAASDAATDAARAASDAAWATSAAAWAASDAAWAATAAAWAASAAARAASAAARAASDAAWATSAAAWAASDAIKTKIINYGLELLRESKNE